MLIKSLKGLFAVSALAMLSACSTPCDRPGGLCAPIEPNTSVVPAQPRAPEIQEPVVPEAEVETMPVDAPPGAVAANPRAADLPAAVPDTKPATRIGLLLPTRSDGLGPPAGALRAGFMAAYERDRSGFVVNLIETGDSPQEVLAAYTDALGQNDIVVGPLARSAVSAIAAAGVGVSKPTLALNHPEGRATHAALPHNMLVMGLSIEDEARQVAQWAASEHPGARALVVSGANAWQRRIASAFAAQWKQLGNQSQTVELAASNGYLSESGIFQLKSRVDAEMPTLLFTALDADQLRQVRTSLGSNVPVYGTSSVNPGTEPGTALAELDGVRLLDLPWEVQPDHPAVMVYPRWNASRRTLDLDRLYALGIDAFRVAREITLHPGASFTMDGVTGKLSVSFGNGPARFERVQPTAVYQGGSFKPSDSVN
ncbi:penicillin-binding protein activator [Massilia pseudoviolaceinigra]|uniref:penicillin-binding protein activator n=1 Tax=Massilia pseudoviolaceinigra TaxID=3057165 RepID=UPI002796B91C|nr:penicillin-binding protein activator [Massilia sp. CCM 9206]MDQ1920435.1 penicillin-binding protein activator [Massilia sp. CCM 9206]